MVLKDGTTAAILLVEDDSGHAVLVEKCFHRDGINQDIVVLDDGRKAVDYLLKQGRYAADTSPAPSCILLDLNLPVLSGTQVLQIIKNDARTKNIPVVVLTTTDNPREVTQCYKLGCNLYVAKPVEYEQFSDMIQKLSRFISIIKTPEEV